MVFLAFIATSCAYGSAGSGKIKSNFLYFMLQERFRQEKKAISPNDEYRNIGNIGKGIWGQVNN
jgi:hypothetical protein